jgi:hypothetical protein
VELCDECTERPLLFFPTGGKFEVHNGKTLHPCRWRQYVSPKRRYPCTKRHIVTTQKTTISKTTSVKTSNFYTLRLQYPHAIISPMIRRNGTLVVGIGSWNNVVTWRDYQSVHLARSFVCQESGFRVSARISLCPIGAVNWLAFCTSSARISDGRQAISWHNFVRLCADIVPQLHCHRLLYHILQFISSVPASLKYWKRR